MQVWCSRDAFRLMQLLDPFRQLHFVYAYRHAGHFFGAWAAFHALTAYCLSAAALSLFALLHHITCSCTHATAFQSQVPGGSLQLQDAAAACGGWDAVAGVQGAAGACAAGGTAQWCAAGAALAARPGVLGWQLPVLLLVQLTVPMLLPHLVHVLLQEGPRAAARALCYHLASGWPLFSVAMERSKAWHIGDSMAHGGSTYLPTGRRFGVTHFPLTRVLVTFLRSHIAYGARLAALLTILLAACAWRDTSNALAGTGVSPSSGLGAGAGAGMGVGPLLGLGAGAVVGVVVCAGLSSALVWAPFLFNPFSLHRETVQRDALQVVPWLTRPATGAPASDSWAAHYSAAHCRRPVTSSQPPPPHSTFQRAIVTLLAHSPALLAASVCATVPTPLEGGGMSAATARAAQCGLVLLLLHCVVGDTGAGRSAHRCLQWATDAALCAALLAVSYFASLCTGLHTLQLWLLYRRPPGSNSAVSRGTVWHWRPLDCPFLPLE